MQVEHQFHMVGNWFWECPSGEATFELEEGHPCGASARWMRFSTSRMLSR